MNGKQVHKDGLVSVFAVNKCYVAAQEGTFFDGSGFLALGKEGVALLILILKITQIKIKI